MRNRPRESMGLIAVGVLAGLLVVSIAGWSHLGVMARMDALRRGEGQLILDALRFSVQDGIPTPEALRDHYDELDDRGLVWVAVLVNGSVVGEAGTPMAPPGLLPTPDSEYLSFDTTARMMTFLPTRPPPGQPPQRVHIVIEYVPENALDLEGRSRRSLGAAVGGAALLWVATAWLLRLSQKTALQEAQLTEHRHLAALGQMSAVMAHEIKNPLASLKGHAQLLARQVPEETKGRAERVVQEAERLETLVYSLLDFARTATLDRALVDPKSLLADAIEETEPDRVKAHIDESPERWSLDATRMRQVLVNLLDNALKASPDGAVEAAVHEEGGELVFLVKDRGPGIPPDQIEQVFEPFFTTRTKGSGLGLAIVRRIARLHGGTVSVVNRPEGGAEFRVAIPPV